MTTLHIHHWLNDCRVPRAQAAQPALEAALDSLSQRVATVLADYLDAVCSDAPNGVALLPCLTVDLALEAPAEAGRQDEIAAHWARQLARAFARALADPASGVVRFESWAAYTAHFLGELAHGRAFGDWRFSRFDGLRALPVPAAIRTLLTDDAGAGRAALALVDAAAWPALCTALTPHEALRILRHWIDRESGSPVCDSSTAAPWLAQWYAADAQGRPGLPRGTAEPIQALHALASWQRTLPEGSIAPVGVACWLTALRGYALTAPDFKAVCGADSGEVLARLCRASERASPGNWTKVSGAEWYALLASVPLDQRAAAQRLANEAHIAVPDTTRDEGGTLSWLPAPHAGLAWLLPSISALFDTIDCGRVLPPCIDIVPRDAAALVTLSLIGATEAASIWRDPFWRTFFDAPPQFDEAALSRWLLHAPVGAARSALDCALRTMARGKAVRVRFGDAANGETERAPIEWLDSATGAPLATGAADTQALGAPVMADAPAWTERLALTRLARDDRRWLGQNPLAEALPPPWRVWFATLAQAVVRHAAYRIPGLARGSLRYLQANVWDVSGQAQRCTGADDARISWRLEAGRPPLYVLLNLTGAARLSLVWAGDRPRSLTLHCPG